MTQALVAQTYHPPFFELSVYKFIFNKISLFLIIKQYNILSIFNQSYRHCSHINSADIFFHLPLKTIELSKNNESVCCLCHRPSWHKITPPLFFYFLFTYLLSIKFLYYFISFSIEIQQSGPRSGDVLH